MSLTKIPQRSLTCFSKQVDMRTARYVGGCIFFPSHVPTRVQTITPVSTRRCISSSPIPCKRHTSRTKVAESKYEPSVYDTQEALFRIRACLSLEEPTFELLSMQDFTTFLTSEPELVSSVIGQDRLTQKNLLFLLNAFVEFIKGRVSLELWHLEAFMQHSLAGIRPRIHSLIEKVSLQDQDVFSGLNSGLNDGYLDMGLPSHTHELHETIRNMAQTLGSVSKMRSLKTAEILDLFTQSGKDLESLTIEVQKFYLTTHHNGQGLTLDGYHLYLLALCRYIQMHINVFGQLITPSPTATQVSVSSSHLWKTFSELKSSSPTAETYQLLIFLFSRIHQDKKAIYKFKNQISSAHISLDTAGIVGMINALASCQIRDDTYFSALMGELSRRKIPYSRPILNACLYYRAQTSSPSKHASRYFRTFLERNLSPNHWIFVYGSKAITCPQTIRDMLDLLQKYTEDRELDSSSIWLAVTQNLASSPSKKIQDLSVATCAQKVLDSSQEIDSTNVDHFFETILSIVKVLGRQQSNENTLALFTKLYSVKSLQLTDSQLEMLYEALGHGWLQVANTDDIELTEDRETEMVSDEVAGAFQFTLSELINLEKSMKQENTI